MNFQMAWRQFHYPCSGIRLGTLIVWRNDKEFDDDDLILVEIASTVVGIPVAQLPTEKKMKKNIRRRTAVTMAINTLSYSNYELFQLF